MSEKLRDKESYNEEDDREEEEQVGNLGREESFSFALRQHLAFLKHQIDEGKYHAVYYSLQKNITISLKNLVLLLKKQQKKSF